MRIDLAVESGVSLRWRPSLLGLIFRMLRWNDSPFNIFAAKERYVWRDLERVCKSFTVGDELFWGNDRLEAARLRQGR